ncbi:MAG: hypothetical protein HY832_02495, partial [Candidatus Aenigmarchaeota archaeon]|nr:hypothetical protein [Candidatus Aenigmarchaeota archaeon]
NGTRLYYNETTGLLQNMTTANLTQTNATGHYNYSFILPAVAGNYTITVNTTYNTVYGNNTLAVSVVSSNTAPSITTPLILPATAHKNDTLNGSVVVTDADGNTMNVMFRWYRNNSNIYNKTITSVATGTNISSLLMNGNYSKNDNITVEVFAYDGTVNSTFKNSTVTTILNSQPIVSTPAIAPSTAYHNDNLNGSSVITDVDTDTMNVTFRWYRNGANIQNNTFSNVANGTNITALFSASLTTFNDQIILEVFVTDATDNSIYQNSSTKTIGNRNPDVTTPLISPPSPYDTYDLNGSSVVTDGDGDSMNVTFRWYRNNTNIQNNTITGIANNTNVTVLLDASMTGPDDQIILEVFATDGTGNSTFRNSSTTTIIAIPPAVASESSDYSTFGRSATVNFGFNIGGIANDNYTVNSSYAILDDSTQGVVGALVSSSGKKIFGSRVLNGSATEYQLVSRQGLEDNKFYIVWTTGSNQTIRDTISRTRDLPATVFGNVTQTTKSDFPLYVRIDYPQAVISGGGTFSREPVKLRITNQGKLANGLPNITIERVFP